MAYGKSGGYPKRNSGGFGGGRRDNGGPSYGGGFNKSFDRGGSSNSRGGKPMHDAVCADCGRDCQVPFRPNGKKPVHCSDCFDKNGGNEGREERRFDDRAPRREFSSAPKREFSAPKPDSRIDDLQASLRSVQSKLDQLISLMQGGAPTKPAAPAAAAPAPEKKGVKSVVAPKAIISFDDTIVEAAPKKATKKAAAPKAASKTEKVVAKKKK